ncbi:TadE family protein [Elusimicrobiota bacterium]
MFINRNAGAPQHRSTFSSGQGLVEVAIIFPLFLIVVFGVMQLGHIAAMTIVVNHASFEVARAGALSMNYPMPYPTGNYTKITSCKSLKPQKARKKMKKLTSEIFENWPGTARLHRPAVKKTSKDMEVNRPKGRWNCELIVKVEYKMPLVFPFVNVMLAQPPRGGYDPKAGLYRSIIGETRMPIEMPLW